MTLEELVTAAADGLGVESPRALKRGGQKIVLTGTRSGEPVVLKVIAVAPADAGHVLERARREVGLLAEIDDPRLVALRSPIVALGPDQAPAGVAWLEEHLDGADLAELLTGVPWSADTVADLLVGVARGLELLHTREVVHRDLSPGNVRRRGDGTWTLMDPGYAKHLAEASITGVYQPGTPGFLSPEHVPGGHPDTYSDVFGVGLLAYLAATSLLPIDPGGPRADYDQRLAEAAVTPVRTHRPDLPTGLAEVIDMCLERQPARRYLDATELLAAATASRAEA